MIRIADMVLVVLKVCSWTVIRLLLYFLTHSVFARLERFVVTSTITSANVNVIRPQLLQLKLFNYLLSVQSNNPWYCTACIKIIQINWLLQRIISYYFLLGITFEISSISNGGGVSLLYLRSPHSYYSLSLWQLL